MRPSKTDFIFLFYTPKDSSTEYQKQPKSWKLPKTTKNNWNYQKQPKTTENYQKQPKTNLSQIPKNIKTTENYSRLVPLDAGMHRKVLKYSKTSLNQNSVKPNKPILRISFYLNRTNFG